jgi:hypothetical protein
MSTISSRVIRLAFTQPALRYRLLPKLKIAANPDLVYQQALENLSDLGELSENVQVVIDGFNQHYASGRQAAGMDPTLKSEYEVLNKATQGHALAQATMKSLTDLVALFPADKKYAKALADATKMVDTLAKQVDGSRKVARALAKKLAPKALADMVKKVQPKIEAWLLDPTKMTVKFWQNADFRGQVFHYGIFQVTTSDNREVALYLRESTMGVAGVAMGMGFGHTPYDWKPATVNEAVDLFMGSIKTWDNVKGEVESRKIREGTANAIAAVIKRVCGRLGWDNDSVDIAKDFRWVRGSYRSNLPKEGAYDVGEARYDEMVKSEIARAKKETDPLLANYKNKIESTHYQAEEKGWISIEVNLK